ncbi:MAG: tRNA lysidine(34) synthetase TilS [Cellvibrionales bacterium]|nr:tRNA lysidine(34) synthetase TilS [Cellvibrionales bacterium]
MLDHSLIDQSLTAKRWVVGLSGGVDSVVLLHLLTQIPNHPPIVALHVNHQMQSEANQWQSFCKKQASALSVDFIGIAVDVDSAGNLEENARNARFNAFIHFCSADDVLMLGHHLQDQTETFFYRLFRGAGVKGLLGIPSKRMQGDVTIVRPLLNTARPSIENYAEHHQLAFIDDPSNKDKRFDRNFIRQAMLPMVRMRWHGVDQKITQTIARLRDAQSCLNDLAIMDLAEAEPLDGVEPSIDFMALQKFSAARVDNALRYWLNSFGLNLSAKQLAALKSEVIEAKHDANPKLIVSGCIIRRYRTRLYLTVELNASKLSVWHTDNALMVAGFLYEASHACSKKFAIRYADEVKQIKLAANRPTKNVKQVYQSLNVPPWRRAAIPWFFFQDECVAIGEYLITEAGKKLVDQNFTVSVRHSTDFSNKI